MITDSQVAELKLGDKVRMPSGAIFTVTSSGKPAPSGHHYEAWAVSPSGNVVIRVTANGGFEKVTSQAIARPRTKGGREKTK